MHTHICLYKTIAGTWDWERMGGVGQERYPPKTDVHSAKEVPGKIGSPLFFGGKGGQNVNKIVM